MSEQEEMMMSEEARQELSKLRDDIVIYGVTHKEPVLELPTFWQVKGIEASLMTISSIAVALYAAIRTGLVFMIAEQLFLKQFGYGSGSWQYDWFPIAAIATVILGIEGFAFSRGLIEGRDSGKLRISKTGIVISMSISGLAGVISSMALWTNAPSTLMTGLYIGLALISGLGCAYTSYLGSLDVGVLRNSYDKVVRDIKKAFRTEHEEWELNTQKFHSRRTNANQPKEPQYQQAPVAIASTMDREIMTSVRQYLQENHLTAFDIGKEPGMVMAPSKLARELGLEGSGSAVRTSLSRLRAEQNDGKIPVAIGEDSHLVNF